MSLLVDNLGRVWARQSFGYFGQLETPDKAQAASSYENDYYVCTREALYYSPDRQSFFKVGDYNLTKLMANYGLDKEHNLFTFIGQRVDLVVTNVSDFNWNGDFLAVLTDEGQLHYYFEKNPTVMTDELTSARIVLHSDTTAVLEDQDGHIIELSFLGYNTVDRTDYAITNFRFEHRGYLVKVKNSVISIRPPREGLTHKVSGVIRLEYHQGTEEVIIFTSQAVHVFSYYSGNISLTNLSGFSFILRYLVRETQPYVSSSNKLVISYYHDETVGTAILPDDYVGYRIRLLQQATPNPMTLIYQLDGNLEQFFIESYHRYVSYHGHDYLMTDQLLGPNVQPLLLNRSVTSIEFLQLGLAHNQIVYRYSRQGRDILVDRYGTIVRCDSVMPGSISLDVDKPTPIMISSASTDLTDAYVHQLAEDITSKLPGDYSAGQLMVIPAQLPSHLIYPSGPIEIIDYQYSQTRGVVITSTDKWYQEVDLSLVAYIDGSHVYAQDAVIPIKLTSSKPGRYHLHYSRDNGKWRVGESAERHLDKVARYQAITALTKDDLIVSDTTTNSRSLVSLINRQTTHFIAEYKIKGKTVNIKGKIVVDINPRITNLAMWKQLKPATLYVVVMSKSQVQQFKSEARRLEQTVTVVEYSDVRRLIKKTDVIACLDGFSEFFKKTRDVIDLAGLIKSLVTRSTVFLWKIFRWQEASRLFYPSAELAKIFEYGEFRIVLKEYETDMPVFELTEPGSPTRTLIGLNLSELLLELGPYESDTITITALSLNGTMKAIAECYELGYLRLTS